VAALPARLRAPEECPARESPRKGLESSKKSRIAINLVAGNLSSQVEEVILMAASNSWADAPQAWVMRAERARKIATMLSRKDAEATEAYARECEARAKQSIDRRAVPSLAA
jgi:hypothetical protein